MIDAEGLSALVVLDRGYIAYQSPYGHAWSIPVAAIALVGQVSVAFGGSPPDTFLVLAFRDLTWHAVPVETPGLPECLDALGRLLGSRLRLADEGDTARNDVLWPPSLEGSPLFTIRGARAETEAGRREDGGSELSAQAVAFLSSGPVALGGVA